MMTNRPTFDTIKAGDAPPPLSMRAAHAQFVRYAGASHDFNPNHHDEVYAVANGNKAVFGMGMLAGGYCAAVDRLARRRLVAAAAHPVRLAVLAG